LDEVYFTGQTLASYIVPGVEKPRKIRFRHGIEETFIAPIERPKELLGLKEEKTKSAPDEFQRKIEKKYGLDQSALQDKVEKKYGLD